MDGTMKIINEPEAYTKESYTIESNPIIFLGKASWVIQLINKQKNPRRQRVEYWIHIMQWMLSSWKKCWKNRRDGRSVVDKKEVKVLDKKEGEVMDSDIGQDRSWSGKKNWLFLQEERKSDRSADSYALVEGARLNLPVRIRRSVEGKMVLASSGSITRLNFLWIWSLEQRESADALKKDLILRMKEFIHFIIIIKWWG